MFPVCSSTCCFFSRDFPRARRRRHFDPCRRAMKRMPDCIRTSSRLKSMSPGQERSPPAERNGRRSLSFSKCHRRARRSLWAVLVSEVLARRVVASSQALISPVFKAIVSHSVVATFHGDDGMTLHDGDESCGPARMYVRGKTNSVVST